MKKNYKIVVVGLGYVGLSNAVLLAQHNEVIGVDISLDRVNTLNARRSPILDSEITKYLAEENLQLSASTDLEASIVDADYVIVSTPTNYDENSHFFDTSSVEAVISCVFSSQPNVSIVVKSTIPVGFTDNVREKFKNHTIMFSPEFLREGSALRDNLYPSRIVIGDNSQRAKIFASLLAQAAIKDKVDVLFTGPREAEAIKLFSNTYLAMRVAFFNELDSYALSSNMNTRDIIDGVSLDPRIGHHYNNPSFGYGGYCLPKDTKQLLSNFDSIPQTLIGAIVASNSTRQNLLADEIIKTKPKKVGLYRLIMKAGSDNFRDSSVIPIIELLIAEGIEVIIYEPTFHQPYFLNLPVVTDLDFFKTNSNLILANRTTPELDTVTEKVFTRDIFGTG